MKKRSYIKLNNVIFEPEEHKYFLDKREYPSYSKIVKHFGMTPDYELFGNETSRTFGQAVHHLCTLYDKDDLGNYDPQLEPWLNGYKRFLKAYNPKWELIEQPLVSKVWGFAGTPDRYGIIKKRALVDFKTGTPEPSHDLQTGAYKILIEENLKVKVQERCSLYLLPNDFRLLPHTNKSDRSVFIGLVQAYNFKKIHKLC